MKKPYFEPWFIRRLYYTIMGVVGLVVAGMGLASPESIDELSKNLEPLLFFVMASGLGVASMNTNSTSDSRVTDEQYEAVRKDRGVLRERINNQIAATASMETELRNVHSELAKANEKVRQMRKNAWTDQIFNESASKSEPRVLSLETLREMLSRE